MTVAGIFTLKVQEDRWMDGTKNNCYGSADSGYADLAGGAQVTVFNSRGAKVALGQLRPGHLSDNWTCNFPFEVDHVPARGNIFSVEVSHRGQVNFTKKQAKFLLLGIGG